MMHTRPVIPPLPNREASGPFAAHPNLAAKHEAEWAKVMHRKLGLKTPTPPAPSKNSETGYQAKMRIWAAIEAVMQDGEWRSVPQITAAAGVGKTSGAKAMVAWAKLGRVESRQHAKATNGREWRLKP